MTFQVYPWGGMNAIPFMPVKDHNPIALSNTTSMTAGTHLLIALGSIWHEGGPGLSKNLDRVEFCWTSSLNFNSSTVRMSIQRPDTAAGPLIRNSGTILGATNSAYKDFTTGSASAWETGGTLTEVAPVTTGEIICVVFAVTSGTPTAVGLRMLGNQIATNLNGMHSPTTIHYNGSAYAKTAMGGNIALHFDDDSWGCFAGGALFAAAVGTTAYGSGSTPDEYGNYIPSLPFALQANGIIGNVDFRNNDDDGNWNVYNTDPTTGTPAAAETRSIIGEWSANVADPNPFFYQLNGVVDFSAGDPATWTHEATAAGSRAIPYIDPPNTTIRDELMGGIRGVSRKDTGTFSEVNSGLRVYMLALMSHGFDDGAGGGGSSTHAHGFVG